MNVPTAFRPHHRFLYRPPPANHPALLKAVEPFRAAPSVLPPSVDLRPKFLLPRDQGPEGCCSGFSTAALREYVVALQTGNSNAFYLSPAYLYARTRMTEGTFPTDAGATIIDEVTTLQNYGVCPEVDLPYTGDASEAPTPQCDVQAVPFRSGAPLRVPSNLGAYFVQVVLAAGNPVVFGMPVTDSFEATGSDGIVPPVSGQMLGGHALLAVGYLTIAGVLYIIVRNSWGTSWGDSGWCYLPADQVASWLEAWTIPLPS